MQLPLSARALLPHGWRTLARAHLWPLQASWQTADSWMALQGTCSAVGLWDLRCGRASCTKGAHKQGRRRLCAAWLSRAPCAHIFSGIDCNRRCCKRRNCAKQVPLTSRHSSPHRDLTMSAYGVHHQLPWRRHLGPFSSQVNLPACWCCSQPCQVLLQVIPPCMTQIPSHASGDNVIQYVVQQQTCQRLAHHDRAIPTIWFGAARKFNSV